MQINIDPNDAPMLIMIIDDGIRRTREELERLWRDVAEANTHVEYPGEPDMVREAWIRHRDEQEDRAQEWQGRCEILERIRESIPAETT